MSPTWHLNSLSLDLEPSAQMHFFHGPRERISLHVAWRLQSELNTMEILAIPNQPYFLALTGVVLILWI
jgi:hypothetical protein